jgi:hypothetical protein
MTHPTREEWMSYLYDETPAGPQESLRAHLKDCSACRTQIDTWQGASRQMNEWQLPRRRKISHFPTVARWAAAAAIAALAIASATNLLATKREVRQLRAEVQAQRELNAALVQVTEQASKSASAEAQTLIAAIVEKLEEKRISDQQTMLAALQNLNTQRLTDYVKLRKELETVALFSEVGLQHAENQISSLAYAPASFSNEK